MVVKLVDLEVQGQPMVFLSEGVYCCAVRVFRARGFRRIFGKRGGGRGPPDGG